MSSNSLGMIIEMLVAILLAITIVYCVLLNQRLKLLKSDEHSLMATISELVTATEIAERAIAGLKETVREGDSTLGERLRGADRTSIGLDLQIAAGRDILGRIQDSLDAARERHEAFGAPQGSQLLRHEEQEVQPPPPRQDPRTIADAAQAFAERLRTRVHGLAA